MKITPYLNFKSQCAEAFAFYETVFNGKILFVQTFGDSPMKDHVGPDAQGDVMHATIQIGDQTIMGSDAPGERYNAPQGFAVSYSTSDAVAAERIYAALVEGGVETMALQETFWAKRFGMLTDRFGIPWMINCESPA